MARTKSVSVPEVGEQAPGFSLPSAQGGQLRLDVRTARGPVVIVFYRNSGSEECVEYFKALAEKEAEINHAGASIVGIGVAEPDESREFARLTGLKSYLLYDYARVATEAYGLLEKDKERGDSARPAAFVVGGDNAVVHAWVDERPSTEEILAKVTEITGLPKAEEDEPAEKKEKAPAKGKPGREPKGGAGDAEGASGKPVASSDEPGTAKREKPSPEEREKRRAERRAAREEEAGGDGE